MLSRPYGPADRAACLRLFRSNVPGYFAAHEETDFARFLDHPLGQYFVFEDGRGTVACGGIDVNATERWIGVIWTIVDNNLLRQGIGREMFSFLMGQIRESQRGYPLFLDTSQHSLAFWEKMGFHVYEEELDGYAPGLHRYELRLDRSSQISPGYPSWRRERRKRHHAGPD